MNDSSRPRERFLVWWHVSPTGRTMGAIGMLLGLAGIWIAILGTQIRRLDFGFDRRPDGNRPAGTFVRAAIVAVSTPRETLCPRRREPGQGSLESLSMPNVDTWVAYEQRWAALLNGSYSETRSRSETH